jgi:bifunctional non-homologous end joining protein LigD
LKSSAAIWRGCKPKNAILDGEIVCLDSKGVSQFKQLLYRRGRAVFYAFDLLWFNGTDLRQIPLIERKTKLQRLIHRSHCTEIIYAQHVEREGKLLLEEVCQRNLEGMVCKRKTGMYAEHGWLKVRNPPLHANGSPTRDVYRVSGAPANERPQG